MEEVSTSAADADDTMSASGTENSHTENMEQVNTRTSTNHGSAVEDTSDLSHSKHSQEIEVVPEVAVERDDDDYASLHRILSRACASPESPQDVQDSTV
jgi:hypothetical protein